MLTNAGRSLLVTGGLTGTITYIGLANSSGTELTGGSPAYARQAVTWNAVSAGTDDQSGDLVFNVPAASEVARVLVRGASSGGTDYGYGWVGGFVVQAATIAQATDTFTSYAHGLTNGVRLGVHPFMAGGLPSPLVEGTLYYAINTTTDTFQLAGSAGGAAVNIVANGECVFQQCAPEQFTQQGTFTVASGDLDLAATAV